MMIMIIAMIIMIVMMVILMIECPKVSDFFLRIPSLTDHVHEEGERHEDGDLQSHLKKKNDKIRQYSISSGDKILFWSEIIT